MRCSSCSDLLGGVWWGGNTSRPHGIRNPCAVTPVATLPPLRQIQGPRAASARVPRGARGLRGRAENPTHEPPAGGAVVREQTLFIFRQHAAPADARPERRLVPHMFSVATRGNAA